MIIPRNHVKFLYRPDYLSRSNARNVENEFRYFLSLYGKYEEETTLALDGGNVVDNGVDKAIITDRFYYENPNEREKVFFISICLILFRLAFLYRQFNTLKSWSC